MKTRLFLAIILLIFLFSCENEQTHSEEINYYIRNKQNKPVRIYRKTQENKIVKDFIILPFNNYLAFNYYKAYTVNKDTGPNHANTDFPLSVYSGIYPDTKSYPDSLYLVYNDTTYIDTYMLKKSIHTMYFYSLIDCSSYDNQVKKLREFTIDDEYMNILRQQIKR